MKNKIAMIADTQLYKKLYGQLDTQVDWYEAFELAFEEVTKRKDEIAAVLLLGDILDANEVGASAAYALTNTLKKFAQTQIPIGMILGNHDNEVCSKFTWVEVAQVCNNNVIRLNLDEPLMLDVDGKTLAIYGTDNENRAGIDAKLRDIHTQPAGVTKGGNVENWLCLHQALKELAPHKYAWDVTTEQVPHWIDRIFLGDFHNTNSYTDILGREFIYPGAIETVSFNQTETPGFIIFDTQSNTYEHISTQQREYLVYDSENKSAEEIQKELVDIISNSENKYGKKPVLKVLYNEDNYTEYFKVAPIIKPLVLKLFECDSSVVVEDDSSSIYQGNVAQEGAMVTKEGILKSLPEILEHMNISTDMIEDIQILMTNENGMDQIKARYPKAVYKSITI